MSNVEITVDELESYIQNNTPLLILDLRNSDNYMNGHIEGAANAKCSNMQQKQAVMSRLPRNQKIVLIDENGEESLQNANMLARFGFDAHFLKEGMKSWRKKLVKSSQETLISNEKLWESLKNNEDIFLLDVREPMEYEEFKIPGAVNVPLSELFSEGVVDKIPKDKKIITICSHGNRSMVATFALAQKGRESTSLGGGMSQWNQVLNAKLAVKEEDFTIIQVEKIGKGCLSYVIGSDGEAIVIDPTYPPSKFLEFAEKERLKITKVIDTHQHADHVSAAKELAKIANADLYFSAREEYNIEHKKAHDGESIPFGKKQIRVMHTPGHTAGSMTYVVDEIYAFVGDTLFVESVGRPDLRDEAEEFASELHETLHNKLLNLPQNAKIFPTHHGDGVKASEDGVFYTTPEKGKNLALIDLSKKEFVSKVVNLTTPRPMNYSTMIKVNKGTIPIMEEQVPDLEMGPNRCSVQ
ncbi:MAG: rhodanese-like domain-containing protein [Nitrosopumilus sp.]|nr:rhodanese-like domain-containing protein [Nitrosopumilus sp.]